MATTTHLHFLLLFTLTLLLHSKPILTTINHHALITLLNHFNISGNLHHRDNLCNTAGISCNTFKVTGIVFKTQRLNGFISPEIGNLSELKELSVPDNYLTGNIPFQISDCRKIEVINLRNNRFSGEVPGELSHLVHLRFLDLSYNEFSGDLGFLKYFPNLETLFLENNMFTGKVPVSLRSFRNLLLFNFSGNSLEGLLPELDRLQSFSPELKRSNYKHLPKRYVFVESAIQSEDEGFDRSRVEAPAPAPVEAQNGNHKKNNRKKIMGWVLGFFAGSIAGILSIIFFSVLIKLVLMVSKYGGNESGPSIFSPLIKVEELAFLDDDAVVATLQVIGRGGCGEVYKTNIPDGKIKTIAIKRVIQPSKDARELTVEDTKMLNKKMRQIRSEIQTVGQIRHRNLLALLAHFSKPTCHYLVYEFMKNGSLQDVLQQVKAGTQQLEWLTRHKIAIGVAAGLEYLHMSHTPRIVHRDLKPGNILLDDDMEARIGDFGLAKSIPEADTHMTSSNVAGTLGYIAPEYHQTLKFTDKCDIYSFGVLLGVLVMGKLPSDEFFQHTPEVNMVKWIRKVMTSDNPKEAIDPSLLGNGYEEQMLLVLKIACFCTLDNPKERPNSKECRCMLAQIKH
ncbi:hypothetical protein QVD17_02497 [Tagetes erecta]|uniref:Protein kinase domain-containing protein n=1 Tax=Tagetes erecta TaxID=13708 RepID=A0AAD8L6Q2_TARER|nr:hypothetical protein QVD17_02497 [Tagetes erecta]